MAKGQITEKDLEIGLKQAGGFSGLTQSKARRDSPFGSEYAKPVEQKVANDAVEKESSKTVELTPVQKKQPEQAPAKKTPAAKPKKVETTKPTVATKKVKETPRRTKADLFSERITLNVSPDTRDQAETLARTFQRRKSDKTERITANTIYRVAIQAVIEELDLLEDLSPNTEEELLELVKEKLG